MKVLNVIVSIIILLAILFTCSYFIHTQQMHQERYSKILSKWEGQQERGDKLLFERERQFKESDRQYERYNKFLARWEEREEKYEKAKEGIDPDELSEEKLDKLSVGVLFDLTGKAYKKGYWQTEVKYSKFIAKKFPDRTDALLYLGQTMQLPWEERLGYLEKAASLPSDRDWIPAQALFRLGEYYESKGDKDKAIEYYREIMERYTRAWNGTFDWVEEAGGKIAKFTEK